MSPYDYLEQHFETFYKKACVAEGYPCQEIHPAALIVAHGDKCVQYRDLWTNAGLSFSHGSMIYLLTFVDPWARAVRQTANGWVPPYQWVVDNAARFLHYLPVLHGHQASICADLPPEYQEQLRLYLRRLANEPAPSRLKVLSIKPDPPQGNQAITIELSIQPWGPDDPIWKYVEDSRERLD